MNSYLNSRGYYDPVIAPAAPKIDTVKDQYRTTVQMDIDVNKNLKIDSVSYDSLVTPELKQLALNNTKRKPFIHK
ncbi:MAG: hypothetical protein WKG06_10590 [Segetibacter sp.]